MKKNTLPTILLIFFFLSNLWAEDIAPKVEALLAKMTLEEKVGQMTLYSSYGDITGPGAGGNVSEKIRTGRCGNIFNAVKVENIRRLQQIAVEKSRLGIPLLFGYDVIHGFKTIFPIPLGMAASWDMNAIENSAKIASVEAAASGINWTFAPMVDIARDPRWGRIAEGGGEDTYLNCEIAKASVRGFQGNNLTNSLTIAACVKHFAAYGAAQAGRDYHTVDMSERMLREVYLPPFKAAVDAGVASLMTSFNEVDGIPATGNSFLLKNILRDEWGFKGVVVTDYTSIKEMIKHGVVANLGDAAALALNAGVDMDMMSTAYIGHVKLLLKNGRISEEKINNAVRNVLTLKFKLGLFDNPYHYCDEQREKELIYTKEHLQAAYDMAAKSMVLLKNKNQLLPLSQGKRIAVIGPLANSQNDLLGTWHAQGRGNSIETVLKGIVRNNGKSPVEYAKGCEVNDNDKSGFAEAAAIANKSDIVVMVLGETESMSGEASSRSNINMPGVQTELLQLIKKTGKPIVMVLMNGRPLALEKEVAMADAILEAWHPGSEGGKAVGDMLFGKLNPSGKLTATFPRNLGQVPIHYNIKNTGRPIDPENLNDLYVTKYIDCPNDPLYPFGYGLSYTDFNYSKVILTKNEIKPGESLKASITISNTGNFDGEEIVQLYIRDLIGSVTRPIKELKGFKKIFLKKGENRKVEFTINEDDLVFLRRDMTWGTEPGKFEIFIGANSRDVGKANFTLNGILNEVLTWMKINQDTTLSDKNLLSSGIDGVEAQTFDNSLAALAFIVMNEKERAERILDFYQKATVKNNKDPLLQNFFLNGEPRGFFQRMAVRDMDDVKKFHALGKSDRWMGDMAWLLMACKQYELKFNSSRYNKLITLISDLFKSWYIPENEGGYIGSGWRKLDTKLHEENGHHEGNVDAYAVFKMIGEDDYADKISRWLLPSIEGENRPLDLFTWKVLAFAPKFANDLNIPETIPGYKKTYKFRGKNVVGFTSSRNNHTNIWTDGLGHIVCAYQAIGNSEKADFYMRQMDKLVMRKLVNGQQAAALPYTATKSPGYEWVNPDKGCLSGAAWYIMARKKFNPMQLGIEWRDAVPSVLNGVME